MTTRERGEKSEERRSGPHEVSTTATAIIHECGLLALTASIALAVLVPLSCGNGADDSGPPDEPAAGDAASVCLDCWCQEDPNEWCSSQEGNACTDDVCSPDGCQHFARSGEACEDGDLCTGPDQCALDGQCIAGPSVECPGASDACSISYCDSSVGCVTSKANEGEKCDDDDKCTSSDACSNGACVGIATQCEQDPLKTCLPRYCDKVDGECKKCQPGQVQCPPEGREAEGAPCEDGDGCTVGDKCDGKGTCTSGLKYGGCLEKECAEVVCVTGANEQGVLQPTCDMTPFPAGSSCDDGNPCTEGDTCQMADGKFTCQAVPASCDDGNPCTVDKCDPGQDECLAESLPLPDGTPCDDNDGLTTGDRCQEGICVGIEDPDADSVATTGYSTSCTGGATMACNDNCPFEANPDQADSDSDGVGDVCEGFEFCDDFDDGELGGWTLVDNTADSQYSMVVVAGAMTTDAGEESPSASCQTTDAEVELYPDFVPQTSTTLSFDVYVEESQDAKNCNYAVIELGGKSIKIIPHQVAVDVVTVDILKSEFVSVVLKWQGDSLDVLVNGKASPAAEVQPMGKLDVVYVRIETGWIKLDNFCLLAE